MGWEDYGSEGFSRPGPELFGFNQVRDAVFGDAKYGNRYACCGGESSGSSDDDDEAEAEAAVCSSGARAPRRATPA